MREWRGLVSSSFFIPTQIPGGKFCLDLAPLFAVKLASCKAGVKIKMRIGNSQMVQSEGLLLILISGVKAELI
jgi:hypothetical protein